MGSVRKFSFKTPDLIDVKGSAMRVIESNHAHVHQACAYAAGLYDLAVADDAYLTMEMVIPEDVEIHIKDIGFFGMNGPHIITMLEKPTSITHGTTAVCQCNRYRNGSDDSVVDLWSDPADIVGGTELSPVLFGGGSGPGSSSTGGISTSSLEWIFEEGVYVLRIQNKSGDVAALGMNINWYQIAE